MLESPEIINTESTNTVVTSNSASPSDKTTNKSDSEDIAGEGSNLSASILTDVLLISKQQAAIETKEISELQLLQDQVSKEFVFVTVLH